MGAGLSFQEYFNYNDHNFDPEHNDLFYSSFGWIGPRFFPTASGDGAATVEEARAVRRGRGPRSTAVRRHTYWAAFAG